MERIKIGAGYFRSGHNCEKQKQSNVYLIDGYAYAKDKEGSQRLYAENEITKLGYVPVNKLLDTFYQASLHSNSHKQYNP